MGRTISAVGAACVAIVLMGCFGPRAGAGDSPAIKTTFVDLSNNANAVITEPVMPDARRSGFAILIAHPEHTNTFDYFIGTEMARRGFRVMMLNYYGPEVTADEFLAPLAAAVKHLRTVPGVRHVVLSGHSTGGAILTYYQDVAENGSQACQGPERVYPCRGKDLDGLPPADGLMVIDSSAGALERLIALDPSVDSLRPRDHNGGMNMFNPRNGFDPKTRAGSYSPEFVRNYLAAQSARQNRLIDEALARLAKIDAGQGVYKDDEPFIVPGSSVHTYDGARIDLADLDLQARTREPHPLIKADGTMPTQVIQSTRPALSNAGDMDRLDHSTQNITVRHFLSFLAMRTKPDYGLGADRVTGVEWRSVAYSVPGNVQGIKVPSLFMSATCAPYIVFTEIAYDLSAAKDKEYVGVEGGDHHFLPCKPEYGDPAKRAFDYVDSWLMKPGRF